MNQYHFRLNPRIVACRGVLAVKPKSMISLLLQYAVIIKFIQKLSIHLAFFEVLTLLILNPPPNHSCSQSESWEGGGVGQCLMHSK